MDNISLIACVTGGRGMVGKRIVDELLCSGYHVRVLSRQQQSSDSRVEVIGGDLCDEKILAKFLSGADLVFHCAAELQNQSLMWDVNVNGTQNVLKLCKKENIKYFCYLSSAGVIGKTQESLVTESTNCQPQNTYERSKWAAEQLVLKGIDEASVVILRPTNIIDSTQPGALLLGKDRSLKTRLKVLLKGAECAHLVHAEDVAKAATYFIDSCFENPECFFVSCDHEQNNTFAGVSVLYQPAISGFSTSRMKQPFHLPAYIPYLIRRIARGGGNLGSVRYSSTKLMEYGFAYKFDLKEMAVDMVLKHGK